MHMLFPYMVKGTLQWAQCDHKGLCKWKREKQRDASWDRLLTMAGVEGGGGCQGMWAGSSEAGKGRRMILLWSFQRERGITEPLLWF